MLAAEFVNSHSRKVTDVMKRDVITASPDDSVADVAARLERHCIKRIPIVKDGRIVGIVEPRQPAAGARQPERQDPANATR